MENFFAQNGSFVISLFLALLLGSFVGLERAIAGKPAGMRTYALVSMGSCLFILISESVRQQIGGMAGFDPLRMASQIIVGIGFIGAGLIIFQGNNIHGLTTAAGLWVTAGLGIAIGFGLYQLALIATLFTMFIFAGLWHIEKMISSDTVPENQERL